ncbi:MAG: DEAD/DEAH box helicase [Hydrogenophaga sp.]|jgi:superfamily II DNA/RNA helicase|nr:DEAD/DEAH box helicase [Hydrogenophaga sp.]
MPFQSLGLVPALLRAATEFGFSEPTPIQAQAIPAVLQGSDVLATARTGSGKTAAFVLPVLQRQFLQPARAGRRIRGLILVPTRELAAQVGEVARSLAQHLEPRPKVAVAFGGVSINPQLMELRGGADVVVGTPGRLLDLVAHNALKLDGVQTLVLDEADRLLDLGFADELQQLLRLLPVARQNLFFSATFPPGVQALASDLLKDPIRIEVEDHAEATKGPLPAPVLQRAILVDPERRTTLLRHLIKEHQWERVLVFVATQYAAERVAAKLHHGDLYATSFHGGLSQGARQQALKEFKEKRWDVVVTTDLAARGIDIAQLPVVVNYDLPRSAVDHVHRIGRTGRAGESGLAVSFISAGTEAHWRLIEKRQGMSLPSETIPGFEPMQAASDAAASHAPGAAPGTGGVKGKRPSKKDKLRAAAALAEKRG